MGLRTKNYQKRLLPNRGSKLRITKIATRSTGMFVQWNVRSKFAKQRSATFQRQNVLNCSNYEDDAVRAPGVVQGPHWTVYCFSTKQDELIKYNNYLYSMQLIIALLERKKTST